MPSMYPDINIQCKNKKSNEEICSKIKNLLDSSNKQIIKIRYKPNTDSLNLIINTSKIIHQDHKLVYKNKHFKLDDLGFELIKRDIGTGYHIPEGVLPTYGKESKDLLSTLDILDTTFIAPLIKYFNVKAKKYMEKI